MAEAIFNRSAHGRAVARSAGTSPAVRLHPPVVEVLGEIGIDVAAARPKGITEDVLDGVDVVVGMGCGDACPVVPGARVIEWEIPDPAGRRLDEVRAVRDEIQAKVGALLEELKS